MTAREVVECVDRIQVRRKANARFDAQLHGAKFKDDVKVEGTPLNAEEQIQAAETMTRMVQEKQEELARRKQGMKKHG